jgi:Homeodomain-like domain
MRPPSVYANPACPAGCGCDVTRLLQGRHRVALRLVMILLSFKRWPPVAIAELLDCDVATVRRWIHRYNAYGVAGLARPAPLRPAPTGQPTAGCADRTAACRAQGPDGAAALDAARPPDHEPADPPPAGR